MKIMYGRCSTQKQEMSTQIQLNEIEKLYGKMDRVFTDEGVSGGSDISKRPALVELLETVTKGDQVFIYSLSRIARDTLQILYIEKEITRAGASIHSVKEDFSDTPEAVMMRTILAAFSQYEKSMIQARTKAQKDLAKKRGLYRGGRADYGYQVIDGQLVEDPEQQKVIKLIVDWKTEGDKLTTITKKLNDQGIESATGGAWNYHSLRKIAQRVA